MRLALRVAGGTGDRDTAIAVLRRAVELGVNHIDTAAFYFNPRLSANELINTALRPYPEDLVIVTKVGPGRDPSGGFLPQARPEQLRGQVEENLRQLGRDHLDVVNLRISDGLERGEGSLADFFSVASAADEEPVGAVAREHGVSPAQVRLAWTLHQGPNVLAIPGTANLAHLEANVAAGALRLSEKDLARLAGV